MKQSGTPRSTCLEPYARRGPHCATASEDGDLRLCPLLVAESPAMRALLRKVGLIAASHAPVVLAGESGSGKEVLARTLHANSPRASKPFLAVNVAALPGELLESELFGHVRGAFTGAVTAKAGLFEAAHGGTLLLDEIADMPLALQAKLLRALQNGEVRRVGDTRSFSVDVRIICATHQDLRSRVAAGGFRADLYYRLNVFRLDLPPLRERVADIVPLARLLLVQEGHAGARLSEGAQAVLQACAWPGNVRQLANALTHAAVLAGDGLIEREHLPDEITQPTPALAPAVLRPLAEVEREHVLRVLQACGGNQAEAARVLGIGRTTLWRKLQGLESATP